MSYLFIFIAATIVVICYAWYVAIINRRNKALETLSGIDVQLKQRSNLIPNILTIAKKFMAHESAIFNEITMLREHVDKKYDKSSPKEVEEHLVVAQQLAEKMSQFKLSVENYPTLKSDATMVQAMQTYNEVEAKISAARRFYNSSVTGLNNIVEIFPGSIIAKLINVTGMPFYKIDEGSKTMMSAKDYL